MFDHDSGARISTLDLCGRGQFTVLTGTGGEAWLNASASVAQARGIEIRSHLIGPRKQYVDHTGDWARAREIGDTGCLLIRPDHHVAWRVSSMVDDPAAELGRVLDQILAK